jgi:hypothetical protein
MKAREVVGRRIIGVTHDRFYNEHLHRWEVVVSEIRLDDGSRLVPYCFETIDQPAATVLHVKEGKRP